MFTPQDFCFKGKHCLLHSFLKAEIKILDRYRLQRITKTFTKRDLKDDQFQVHFI